VLTLLELSSSDRWINRAPLDGFGARDDLDQLLGDVGLAGPVVDQRQPLDHVARVARGIVHGGHPRALFRGGGFEQRLVDLDGEVARQQFRQDLEVAKSEVAVAEAEVTRSQAQEYRQRELLKNGFTTQVAYDQAIKTFKTAQAQLDAARARQVQATENLGYTDLKADNDGVITAVGADAGQVVSAGQMVVRLAQPGEREAVFNVAEGAFKNRTKDPVVTVQLVSNPESETTGKVRYVSPQADPTTRTYTVRVSLPDAPQQMRLGANVVGSVTLDEGQTVSLPGTALFQKDGKPAVWVVDKDGTVQLKPITVQRYQGASVIVGDGLSQGEVVVTAGVQKLLPGQKVRVMQASAQG